MHGAARMDNLSRFRETIAMRSLFPDEEGGSTPIRGRGKSREKWNFEILGESSWCCWPFSPFLFCAMFGWGYCAVIE